jgi:hypothetical protein
VLDPHGAPVPPGALGELYLAGPGLNRGYTSPALTASSYVPNPFGPAGSRLFRTGDLVRRSPSGALLHHGRTDHQVKVRGVRVELDACEAALRRCPGVRAAAVVLREGNLVAYVVGDADGSQLRRRLAALLPSAMVPNHYVRLPELPHTATGKIDRRGLPDPRTVREQGPVAPRDAAELRMRACWEDVLARERIGVRDDFFASGGTSLTVALLVRRIEQAFGLELGMAAVFTAPTIEDLCAAHPRTACAGHVLRLRTGPDPVIVVPDVTGGAARYQPLADALRRGVFALEAVGRAPGEQPLATITGIAAAYARELRGLEPSCLVGWGWGARVAVALAGVLERLGTPPRLVVAVHPRAEPPTDGTPVARYAAVCGLPALDGLDGATAVAAVLRHHKRMGQLPPSADDGTMRRLIAVCTAAEAAQRSATTPVPISADLLHVHAAGAPRPDSYAWASGTGRTAHVVAPTELAAVPGSDELAVVGGLLDRESGMPC